MVALSNDRIAMYQHRSNHRVGRNPPLAEAGQLEAALHVWFVLTQREGKRQK
jgi:hypothetical protein